MFCSVVRSSSFPSKCTVSQSGPGAFLSAIQLLLRGLRQTCTEKPKHIETAWHSSHSHHIRSLSYEPYQCWSAKPLLRWLEGRSSSTRSRKPSLVFPSDIFLNIPLPVRNQSDMNPQVHPPTAPLASMYVCACVCVWQGARVRLCVNECVLC